MLKDILAQAWEAMVYNRRRTAITMIGMAWGIATVVLLLAYGAGFSRAVEAIFAQWGTNVIGAFPGRTSQQAGGDKAGVRVRFMQDDVDRVAAAVPGLGRISPQVQKDAIVKDDLHTYTWTVNGVLPDGGWAPHPAVWVVAAEYETGRRVAFGRPGVPACDLRDAVMASCAVPGVWPPVPVRERVLIDGGVRSISNADLAAGADEVLVLLPMAQGPVREAVESEVARLRDGGCEVTLVAADDAAAEAMGADPLDPGLRPVSAEHGRRQGLAALSPR